jgi:hypothetical protein
MTSVEKERSEIGERRPVYQLNWKGDKEDREYGGAAKGDVRSL